LKNSIANHHFWKLSVKHAWVGAHNLNGRPGDWRWLDGGNVDQDLWYLASDGHCSTLCPRYQLHSFPCSETVAEGFVCQVPSYCTPPPSTEPPATTERVSTTTEPPPTTERVSTVPEPPSTTERVSTLNPEVSTSRPVGSCLLEPYQRVG
jgi:hypothetical protein